MDRPLSMLEARVLGCLIEKEATTPECYPLTLNALTAACNQKSNRDPAMQVGEAEVLRALDSLRDLKLVWEASSSSGRALKYRHDAKAILSVSSHELALLCELLLRGAQTAGELRTRASRIVAFADVPEVAAALEALMSRPDTPLVATLPHAPGQRETRYAQLLCGPPAVEEAQVSSAASAARLVVMAENERIAKVESEMAALRAEVGALRAELAAFAMQFK